MGDGEIVDVESVVKCVTPELEYIVRIERSEAKVYGCTRSARVRP
jgi:hypothetical protein